MDIFLAPNIERLLRNKVAEGIYNSLNEAINVTLGIALTGKCISQTEIDTLNHDIQIGLNDAEAGNLSDAFDFLKEIGSPNE